MDDFKSISSSPVDLLRIMNVSQMIDELPPPIPLIRKTFRPMQPAVHIGRRPFIEPIEFKGVEKEECESVKDSGLNQRVYNEASLQELFSNNVIYSKEGKAVLLCNKRLYDLSHVLLFKQDSKPISSHRELYESNCVVKEFAERAEKVGGLAFESRFESGNLAMVSLVEDGEYNLLLQNDVNSVGNTQWYFFRVKNTKKGEKVRFNILNFTKRRSLYQNGMKPCIFSQSNNTLTNESWFRGGESIHYYPNNILRPNKKSYYTLSFDYTFPFDDDTVFFAYSFPYTYTDLLKLLDTYENNQRISNISTKKIIGRSIGGNLLYLLTITNPGTREEMLKKKVVFISARVHPGESVSSYMVKGILDFITSSDSEAELLRELFIFKVVPMLNPDGVINGNYRCSLLGVDLNRRWKKPNPNMHPEVFYYKKVIQLIHSKYEVCLIVDLHGHSIRKNIFMYGCNYPDQPYLCKIFPYILAKKSSVFSFQDSRFSMHESKSTTLRVSLFKLLKIPNIFTIEASFCGSDFGEHKDYQYTTGILNKFGVDFCKSLLHLNDCISLTLPRNWSPKNANFGLDLSKPGPNTERPTKNLQNLEQDSKSILERNSSESLENNGKNITEDITDRTRLHFDAFKSSQSFFSSAFNELMSSESLLHNGETSDSGSDSDPSEDNQTEANILKSLKRKLKQQNLRKFNTSVPAKATLKVKCKICGKPDFADHVCIPKLELKESKTLKKIQTINLKAKSKQVTSPTSVLPSITKVQSEKIYKKSPKIPLLSQNPQRGNFSKFPPPDLKHFVSRDRSSEFYDIRSSQEISPLNGVHLLGIIEGISCRITRNDRLGVLNRPKHYKN